MRLSFATRTATVAIAAGVLWFVGGPFAAEQAASKPRAGRPAPGKLDLPQGWKLLYSQTFDKPDSVQDFEFTSPDKWKWTQKDGDGGLESLGTGGYKTKVRSPFVIGLLKDRVFGDFILEADLLQTGKEYGHRDMCVFFGFTDRSRYYYVHLATKADNNAHNVFIVNDKPRTNIAEKTTKGIDWGKDVWHRVRVVRKAAEGTVEVFFDDMSAPMMIAKDKTFASGRIGFGSFDDVGLVDNVRIWGPEVKEGKTPDAFGESQPAASAPAKAPPKAPEGR